GRTAARRTVCSERLNPVWGPPDCLHPTEETRTLRAKTAHRRATPSSRRGHENIVESHIAAPTSIRCIHDTDGTERRAEIRGHLSAGRCHAVNQNIERVWKCLRVDDEGYARPDAIRHISAIRAATWNGLR